MRITGGNVVPAAATGGGILNQGGLTLTDCAISMNKAWRGGAIAQAVSATGTLTLKACTIAGNSTSENSGGGINQDCPDHPVILNACTVSGNTSAANGGGIYVSTGPVNITGSTIEGNDSASDGGGIYSIGNITFDITSRVTGNTAGSGGGGIHNHGSVTLNGASVSGNTPKNCAGTVAVNECID